MSIVAVNGTVFGKCGFRLDTLRRDQDRMI